MALSSNQATKLLAAAAALSTAIGVGVVWSIGSETSTVQAALLDAGLSASSGLVRMTDLLTAPIAPGATAHATVDLPWGAAVVQVVAPPPFTATPTTTPVAVGSGGTVRLDVAVTNTGASSARFVGFVVFTAP